MRREQRRVLWIGGGTLMAGIIVWLVYPRTSALEPWLEAMRARGETFELQKLGPPPGERGTNGNAQFLFAVNGLRRHYSGFVTGARDVAPGRIELIWRKADSVPGENLTWESLEKAMSNAESALGELRALLEDPPAELGWDYADPLDQPRNPLEAKRTVAQAFVADLTIGLRRGERGCVLDDIEALCDLARMHAQEYSLVNQMIRQAIGTMAISGTWQALQLDGWTEEEYQRLDNAWEQTRILDAMPRTLEVERASALHLYNTLRADSDGDHARAFVGSDPHERLLVLCWGMLWAERDILLLLRTEQSILDAFRLAAAGGSWSDMQPFLVPAFDELAGIDGDWAQMRYLFTRNNLSNWRRASERLMEFETKRVMVRIALALERYRLRMGRAPSRLEDLVPELLDKLPLDPMNGEPFRYAVDENGVWTLYSVGLNGADDGGDPRPVDPSQPDSGAWGGKDLVWPRVGEKPASGNAVAW